MASINRETKVITCDWFINKQENHVTLEIPEHGIQSFKLLSASEEDYPRTEKALYNSTFNTAKQFCSQLFVEEINRGELVKVSLNFCGYFDPSYTRDGELEEYTGSCADTDQPWKNIKDEPTI